MERANKAGAAAAGAVALFWLVALFGPGLKPPVAEPAAEYHAPEETAERRDQESAEEEGEEPTEEEGEDEEAAEEASEVNEEDEVADAQDEARPHSASPKLGAPEPPSVASAAAVQPRAASPEAAEEPEAGEAPTQPQAAAQPPAADPHVAFKEVTKEATKETPEPPHTDPHDEVVAEVSAPAETTSELGALAQVAPHVPSADISPPTASTANQSVFEEDGRLVYLRFDAAPQALSAVLCAVNHDELIEVGPAGAVSTRSWGQLTSTYGRGFVINREPTRTHLLALKARNSSVKPACFQLLPRAWIKGINARLKSTDARELRLRVVEAGSRHKIALDS